MINKTKIAIIRGGGGYERELSMQSGANVIENLSPEKYIVFDVLVAGNGDWYLEGRIVSPDKLLIQIDVVFNSLLDSKDSLVVQKILDDFGVKYIGSDTLSSALSMNKILANKVFDFLNIKTPYREVVRKEDDLYKRSGEIFRSIPSPYVVKSADGSISFGMNIANTLSELTESIERILEFSNSVLVEELIRGQHITCGVINNFRDKEDYILLPVKIISNNPYFINYNSKRSGDFETEFSGFLNLNRKKEIEQIAVNVHKNFGLGHYSTSDFVFSKNSNLYLLEINSRPALHKESVFVKALEAIGSNLGEFLDEVILS